ncbi:VanW family protein [Clostridium sp.]|uniref:VanW family protein n=1 Tax=Clostridium sp. TaxID=1506 RepID=UPI003217DEB6
MKSKFTVFMSSLVVILIAIIISIVVKMYLVVEEHENSIYKGISINGIDVSLLTRDEAIEKVSVDISIHNEERKIEVKADEKSYETTFIELEVRENIEAIVELALKYGKGDKFIDRYKHVRKGLDRDFRTSTTLNEEKFQGFLKKIEKEQNKAPINALIDHDWNGFSITPHEIGKSVNRYEVKKKIKSSIDNSLGDEDIIVDVIFSKDYPNIMDVDLKSINSLISSYTTGFPNSTFARSKNIEIAAKYINNTVLMPGEEFSFNKVVGMTTSGKGYEYAKVIKNGTFVDEIGGGVCQVSSTLYNAVLKSSLFVSERRNHSKVISYVPRAQDAMISYGGSDFKFINTFNYPIFLEAKVANKEITFNIYSNKDEKGPNYQIINEIVKEIKPRKEIIYDYGLSEGIVVIQQQGQNGYVINTYRVLYKDGKIVEKIFVSESIYAMKNTIIRKGKD